MAISAEMLHRIMVIRKDEITLRRIYERKRYEDAAIALIEYNFGKLEIWHIDMILTFINMDFRGGYKRDRFGYAFSEANRKRILSNPPEALNELFIEIFWRENIDAADDLIKRLTGVNIGFVSCLLYLKNRERYNVMLEELVRGAEMIFGERITGISFKEKYTQFNRLANELKRICNLKPQEVDIILWRIQKTP